MIQLVNYQKESKEPDNTVYRRREDLAGLGIHWCLIPREYSVDHLVSPIELLDSHLGNLDDIDGIMNQKSLVGSIEADMLNSITV